LPFPNLAKLSPVRLWKGEKKGKNVYGPACCEASGTLVDIGKSEGISWGEKGELEVRDEKDSSGK